MFGGEKSMNTFRTVTTFVLTLVFISACENGTAPGPGDPDFLAASPAPTTPVASVPQSRPYPGTKVRGQGSVCKDASSPAGTYTFNVSVSSAHSGDLVASSVSLSPGQCSIVYTHSGTPGHTTPFIDVTVTEVIPAQSTYSLDRVLADDNVSGPHFVAGPSVTFTVNPNHGGYTDFFNVVVNAQPVPPLVPLGFAGSMGILAATTITCVTAGIVNGDIGNSPGTAATGFGPCQLTGTKHLGDGVAAQAQLDLTTAFNTLMGLACPPANVISADLGGTTKHTGVYCSPSTSMGATGNVTLDAQGDPNATFVFQIGSTLTTAGNVVLIGGAQAKNVYWVVGSSATLGTSSQWQGNILAQTAITLNDYVSLIGRALARDAAVTMGTGVVITLP
jgi:hypothetical protein